MPRYQRGTPVPPPEALHGEAQKRVSRWCRTHPDPRVRALKPRLASLWEDCRLKALKKGTLWVDWEAAFREWVKLEVKFTTGRPVEMPQERGQRGGELEPLLRIIEGGK